MIHILIGTKAQLIKMAPLMANLAAKGFDYRFILTGQHRATMNDLLADFKLKQPDLVLYDGPDIVSVKQMLSWALRLLWKSLRERQRIFGEGKNSIVLVHGDTLSTLLGALMGRLAGLTVGHVEAGLRSFNLLHPFPEELTRRLVGRLSQLLFCPGPAAMANVEHLGKTRIDTGGNTMLEALQLASGAKQRRDHIPAGPYGIVSIHRYENIFRMKQLTMLTDLLMEVSGQHRLLFILHPPTRRQLERTGLYQRLAETPGIELRERYGYFDFAALLAKASFVLSDGGSLQEECSYLGIPCLLLRRATERPEGLHENVVLSGYDKQVINSFLTEYQHHRRPPLTLQEQPTARIIEAITPYA